MIVKDFIKTVNDEQYIKIFCTGGRYASEFGNKKQLQNLTNLIMNQEVKNTFYENIDNINILFIVVADSN